MSEPRDELFERNRAFFEERRPKLWAALQDIGEPLTRIVEDENGPVNIDLGKGELYPTPAPHWTRAQLDAFYAEPDRIYFSDPNHCNISPISLELVKSLADFIRERDWTPTLSAMPVVDVGFLFVFGVGLGLHLDELIEKTPSHHVFLIEPIPEFILHSMRVVDWQALTEKADERNIRIHIIVDSQPHDIAQKIEAVMIRVGATFLDGSFHCPHYYSWTLKEAYTVLQERLKHQYISAGFFEDEVEMIRNCHGNMRDWSFHLVENKAHLRQDFPIFIVGAGPSLDRDMKFIKKWRDKALVFSCGTALRILLKNGIRPDFQVENERGDLVPKLLGQCNEEFGLDGITLIASTTAHPDLTRLFDSRWYYFRAALSPADVMAAGTAAMTNTDPLVSNAAFAITTTLGFQNIYLFGCDCGQKETAKHHAKDSIYYTKEHVKLDESYRKRNDRIVPGNFGGNVRTYWALDLSRRMLGDLQAARKVNLYNCSDGAKIVGAEPKVAAAINLPDTGLDRARVIQRLESQMRHFGAGEIFREIDWQPHIDATTKFLDAFREFIAEARAEDTGFWQLEERYIELWKAGYSSYRTAFAMGRGSMRSMIRMGAFFGNRIVEEDRRQEFFEFFLDGYLERVETMVGEILAFLEELQEDRRAFVDAPLPAA